MLGGPRKRSGRGEPAGAKTGVNEAKPEVPIPGQGVVRRISGLVASPNVPCRPRGAAPYLVQGRETGEVGYQPGKWPLPSHAVPGLPTGPQFRDSKLRHW